jgi:predicted SAM-dependent methyltransferase
MELERERLPVGNRPSSLPASMRSAAWQLFSWVGQRVTSREPPEIQHPRGGRYLNVGCGPHKLPGWINADVYRIHDRLLRPSLAPDWMVDLTRPLPCPNGRFDGAFAEHICEHLSYSENVDLLAELRRVLRAGGTLRVVVPDLDRYLCFATLQERFPKFSRYASLPEAISNLTQSYAHRSVWNATLLSEVLEAVGFTGVEQVTFGIGRDETLLVDQEKRQWESCYVEGTVPATG